MGKQDSFGAAIMIAVGPDGKIALVRDSRYQSSFFKFPGGGIHQREWPADAAKRELRQETGLRIASQAQYLFHIGKGDHNLYVYYGTIASWSDLAQQGDEGEEIWSATAKEIFLMNNFLRSHQEILARAIRILGRRGIIIPHTK